MRKITEDDLELLLNLKNESWFGTHTITINNIEEQRQWFESLLYNHQKMYMMVIHNGMSVGVYKLTDIDWISRRYHSAHDVFESERGKGFGKKVLEAGVDFGMEVLNMHRIDTEVLENNRASQKCIEWVGYQKEGVRRKCIYKCGQWLDSICYGLLREDWQELDRVKAYGDFCNSSYSPKNG